MYIAFQCNWEKLKKYDYSCFCKSHNLYIVFWNSNKNAKYIQEEIVESLTKIHGLKLCLTGESQRKNNTKRGCCVLCLLLYVPVVNFRGIYPHYPLKPSLQHKNREKKQQQKSKKSLTSGLFVWKPENQRDVPPKYFTKAAAEDCGRAGSSQVWMSAVTTKTSWIIFYILLWNEKELRLRVVGAEFTQRFYFSYDYIMLFIMFFIPLSWEDCDKTTHYFHMFVTWKGLLTVWFCNNQLIMATWCLACGWFQYF